MTASRSLAAPGFAAPGFAAPGAATIAKSERWYGLTVLSTWGAILLWSYWSSLADVADRWANDPQYAQGYLVLVFSLAVLWARRKHCTGYPLLGNGWGIFFVVLGLGSRLIGAHYYLEWLELVAILPCLAGFCLCLGGWRLLRGAAPAIGLLAFLVPLPYRVEAALSAPLRRLATTASAFLLQMFGFPAIAEQNVILVNDLQIGVVEACSGLGMIVTLFALVVTTTFFVERRPWEKTLMLVSAPPLAVLANVARITLTGVLYQAFGDQMGDAFLHDLAGWFMMPIALILIWFECKLLDHLFIDALPKPRAA